MSEWSRSEARILAEMVRFPVESRGALGHRLDRNKASVARTVDRLLKDGAILEAGQQSTLRRGRRAVSLRLRPDLGYLVGADLEGLAARACVMDCGRHVLASGKFALDPGWPMARKVKTWIGLIEDVISRSGVERKRIAGLGVGLPGVVQTHGASLSVHLPPDRLMAFDLEPKLKRFGLPFTAANNVLCVAEYERRMGVAIEASSFIAVLVRYGIGAAVFSDRHFLVGNGVFAGEMGHMRINLGGPECVCGRRGCLDVYASGRTWPPVEQRSGTAWRRDLARRGHYLGIGVANLLKLCHAPLVILNGIYNDYTREVLPAMQAELKAELAPLGLSAATVVFGEPVECKSAIGAALRAADASMTSYFMEKS